MEVDNNYIKLESSIQKNQRYTRLYSSTYKAEDKSKVVIKMLGEEKENIYLI